MPWDSPIRTLANGRPEIVTESTKADGPNWITSGLVVYRIAPSHQFGGAELRIRFEDARSPQEAVSKTATALQGIAGTFGQIADALLAP